MLEIDFQIDKLFQAQVEPEALERALSLTWTGFGNASASQAVDPSLTLVITDNAVMQELNAQYRGIDAPTDVLSFENRPDPEFPELDEAERSHLGDIVIAYPLAQAQALAAGHPPQAEIILLAVHGLLHLLGFDHDTPEHKQKMWQAQGQIMTELGLARVQPTES